MRIARSLLALTLCFASESAAQCVNAKRATPSTPVAVAEAAALVRFGQHLAGTRAEMRARHGAPLEDRKETTSWFGAAAIDTAYDWRYATFAVSGVRAGDGDAEMAAFLSVFGRMEESPLSVRVGLADTASVARFLGPAPLTRLQGDTTESCYRLAPDGDADEGLSLRFVRGKLVTAIWDFYTG